MKRIAALTAAGVALVGAGVVIGIAWAFSEGTGATP